MARLRQQYPQNYGSSGNINTEFENLIRYINAAEFGGNTLGELLEKIFDANGVWDGPVEFRKDSSAGIQYRIGEYSDSTTGWVTLATLAEIRGEPGTSVGEIGAPIITARSDVVATSAQTVFDYQHDSTDDLIVFVDGILQRPGASYDYVASTTAGSGGTGAVTFNSGLTAGETVSIYKIRSTSITGFTRSDILTTASQQVFAFAFDENTRLQVYKNGILQREGGSYDYTLQHLSDTVTFNSALPSGNLVTIITVENTTVSAVSGMMFEDNFVTAATGLIRYDKIGIADGDIPQAKVASLVSDLTSKAKLTVSGTAPAGPATGDIWLDTSQTPNQLKFYDGTQFLRTSPESSLPTFSSTDAAKFVRVNGTGTALEYANVDLSSVIAVTQKGAANGVASLDSTGRLPIAQLPETLSTDSFFDAVATPSATTVDVKRIYKQKIRIDGLALRCSSGTCSVQISVDGVGVGSTYSVSSTPSEFTLGTPIEINATTTSKMIQYIVSSVASTADLEVTFAITVISS